MECTREPTLGTKGTKEGAPQILTATCLGPLSLAETLSQRVSVCFKSCPAAALSYTYLHVASGGLRTGLLGVVPRLKDRSTLPATGAHKHHLEA